MFHKNRLYILLFFLIVILVVYIMSMTFIYKNYKIEKFGSSTDMVAFDRPPMTKWMHPASKTNWLKLVDVENYRFSDLEFTTPNTRLSVSFQYMCLEHSTYWRNIFRFSNKTNGDDGEPDGRIPGLWVWPTNPTKKKHRLHFRVGSNSSWNDGIDTIELSMGTPMLITFVIDGNTVYYYLNNIQINKGNFDGLKSRTDSAILKICDSGGNGSILIKNLTFYDGVLTQLDIDNIMDFL